MGDGLRVVTSDTGWSQWTGRRSCSRRGRDLVVGRLFVGARLVERKLLWRLERKLVWLLQWELLQRQLVVGKLLRLPPWELRRRNHHRPRVLCLAQWKRLQLRHLDGDAISDARQGCECDERQRGEDYVSHGWHVQSEGLGRSFCQHVSWLAYPGQTPVVDGSAFSDSVFNINANSVTIAGLTIQNAFVPINISGADAVVVRNNTILNSRMSAYTGAVHASSAVTHMLVSHNLINGGQGRGISIDSGSDATLANTSSGNTIEYNVVINTNTAGTSTFNDVGCDTGAIYLDDRPHASQNNVINNNIVGNYGTNSFGYPGCYNIVAIYLDDEQSNVTVTNNIVYGTGEYGLLIHGGDHVTISNNIFDLNGVITSNGQNQIGFYQGTTPNDGMGSNVFTKNIVYSAGKPPSSLWNYDNDGETIARPAVAHNLYFDTSGTLPNSGSIVDTAPLVSNPLFQDPSNLAGTYYALQSSSPAITQLGFVPIQHARPRWAVCRTAKMTTDRGSSPEHIQAAREAVGVREVGRQEVQHEHEVDATGATMRRRWPRSIQSRPIFGLRRDGDLGRGNAARCARRRCHDRCRSRGVARRYPIAVPSWRGAPSAWGIGVSQTPRSPRVFPIRALCVIENHAR